MANSSLATVAWTPGELALEYVDAVAVLGPSWPWGLSPGPEIAEGLELAVEADVKAEEFEVEGRENFFTLSPPHLEDPLLLLINVSGLSLVIFTSLLISPVLMTDAPRGGLSSMALCPLPSGASPTASGATGAMPPSKVFSPGLSSPGRCPLMTTGARPPTTRGAEGSVMISFSQLSSGNKSSMLSSSDGL